MAVTAFVRVRTKPGQEDKFVDYLAGLLGDSRAWNGCMEIRVVRDQADESEVYIVERWQTRKDHEDYLAWRAESGTTSEAQQYLEGPMEVRYFDELDV